MAAFLCASEDRREAVRRLTGTTPLNGIDFVEVQPATPTQVEVHFLHPIAIPLATDNFFVEGGARITGLQVTAYAPNPATGSTVLTLTLNTEGDRSNYTLRIGNPFPLPGIPSGIDPQLSAVDFVFHPECGTADCAATSSCPPTVYDTPQIDYLARDYGAMRRQLFDRVSLLVPGWRGRNAAEVGAMLLEVLAYTGDYLSYRQDAVATEAYLSTARLNTSVKRHARLMDYQMHSGHNARVWVQLHVTADVPGGVLAAVPTGSRLLTDQPGLQPALPTTWNGFTDAVHAGTGVFESMRDVHDLLLAHNELPFHTWGASECCLPKGGTRATLRGRFDSLRAGDVLVLCEMIGPKTGDRGDADAVRRQAVRLLSVDASGSDPYDGQLITEITWHPEDALQFALCIASRDSAGNPLQDVSMALGNIVLADHGRTIGPPVDGAAHEPLAAMPAQGRYLPQLAASPVTFATPALPVPLPGVMLDSAAALFATDPRKALPEVTLTSTPGGLTWLPRLSLLDRDIASDGAYFVAESEPGLGTTLRFGDDTHGRKPDQQTVFSASYRLGNGRDGNVGGDSIHHVMLPHSEIDRVWNPLPASGGVEPETIDQARQKIPYAYRTQQRAVTSSDYVAEAMAVAGVQRASARMRWTGSWHTVTVVVDALGGALTEALKDSVTLALEEKRMAGHDVEVMPAMLVPLSIEMHVCTGANRYREDVRTAILSKLNSGIQPDGSPGLFHPDVIVMGERFYMSPLIAAVQSIAGVSDVRITHFEREGQPGQQGIIDGFLTPGLTEAFSIANDPNFPEHGTFKLIVEGGL
ncbi:putative phage Mu protein gp47-like protein [Terriglobus roseus DSM 18391]|uniref:Putative phage Mu protein gp47-like protein n=1 Tax=Terriglobus roseus (strain DSM 18391 / NRRL B-41598 / KBS 63) TaxID=926566 RepID=I3ZGQ5_TERRK|nr:baseplate J/gp47 family protein [Terriglobus roseus]AFL88423.1 putative phage Mu protein gp47-like protein [Terriglobus roseus DSM 18391]AFL88764.1 putative phage Mu protein gp47-like protein [Terriglobus roseus DSM 18391]